MVWESILSLTWLSLVSVTSVQAASLGTMLTSTPLVAMFEYWPPDWPVDPSNGWNFTNRFAPEQAPAYSPPDYSWEAMPHTTRAGSKVTARFFGTGVTFGGWTTNGSRVTVGLTVADANHEKTEVTSGGSTGDVVRYILDGDVNGWHTMTITLEEGELQIYNITIFSNLEANYPTINSAPEAQVEPLDGRDVTGYYNISKGGWEAQQLWEPGVYDKTQPHMEGKPGSTVTFRTWPNATYINLSAKVGPKMGTAKYEIDPPPLGLPTAVEHNLSRPMEAFTWLGREVLDPTVRYNVTVTNTDANRSFSFGGASYILSTDASKDWDWRNETGATGLSAGNITTTNSTNSTVDGVSSTNSSNSSNSTENSNTTKVADSHSSDSRESHTNVGAIVGGVIGGVVGGALLVGALLWCLCRSRRRSPPSSDDGHFVVDDTSLATSAPVTPYTGLQRYGSQFPGQPDNDWHEAQQLLGGRHVSHPPSQDGHTYRPQEADAGPLNLDTVPPSYNPAWAGTGAPSTLTSDLTASRADSSSGPTTTDAVSSDQQYLEAKQEHITLTAPVEPTKHREASPLPSKQESSGG